MMQQESEQTLEWKAPYFGGVSVFYFFLSLVTFFLLLYLLDNVFSVTTASAFIILFVVLHIVMLIYGIAENKVSRLTLHIDRRTVTLSYITVFGAKEHRMDVDGTTKVHSVYLKFFDRLFTFDTDRWDAPYQVKISSRNSETLLIPCYNEMEQRQIIVCLSNLLKSLSTD